uniref:PH domain-containing protein n=1 Tax=Panagrolaimus superbus TaxID=310955 RepID=A0A914Y9X7_9BILA
MASDLDPDFTIEALVSAKRINNNARLGSSSSPFQSLTNTVSRSFGRRFGANYKKYSQAQSSYTISAYNFPSREEIFSSPFEDLLPVGRCFFRLENAGLSGKIRVYSLALVSAETINPLLPSSDLLPLFGTMCSQVLCVPDCLQITFIRSILDIFYVDEQLLLEKLECALEGGRINCFTKDNKKEAALIIPIDQRTKLHTTAYQTALRITLLDDETKYTQDFIFILSNNNQITDWSYSLKQQITNATAWKEFASISTNPFALKYGSNEFMKKSFDDTLSIKGRTMTNTDEIRGGFKSGGLREVSKRGDRRRVQSVFKDIPKNEEITEKSKNEDVKKLGEKIQNQSKETNEYSKLKSESKEDSKLKITSISKPSLKYPTSNKTSAPKQQQQVSEIIQRPKIVETKPTPKPRSIDSPSTAIVKPRLIDPSSLTANNSSKMPPSKQVVLVNHGYVSSQTKTSPRIARKEQQPPTIIPPGQSVTTSVKYVDSVKSVAEKEFENEPKPRQKVKLEFKEDSVEQSRLPPPPRPHRVSRPLSSESGGTNSNNKTTAIPVIIENSVKKSGNNNNSIKVPPNTYVIRLKVGMEDDDSDGINRGKI